MAVQVGRRIRAFREERGWSRALLASRLEISRRWLESWENGSSLPSTYTLYQLTGIFQVSTAALLDDISPEPPLAAEARLLKVFRFAACLPKNDQDAIASFLFKLVEAMGSLRGWLLEDQEWES